MCTPAASIAMTVASGLFQAYAQIQAGKAAEAEANYRAQIADNNKIEADQLAADALLRGKADAATKREENRQLLGLQRTQLAASGQVVDEGTSLELQVDTAGLSKLDDLTVLNNAEREARGFRVQGVNFQAEANLLRLAGSNAGSAARTNALGTLLKTGSSATNQFNKFKLLGAFA